MIESEIPEIFLTELNKLADKYNPPEKVLEILKREFLKEVNTYPKFSFDSGLLALYSIMGLCNKLDEQKKEVIHQ